MSDRNKRASAARLGRALRDVRTARGLTQEAVAEHLGVSVSTISCYEAGTKTLSALRLLQIARLLKLDLERAALTALEGAP